MEAVATNTKSTIMPTLRYKNAPAAIEWLCHILGFERHAVYTGSDGTIAHAELTLGGGMIMLGSQRDDAYGRGFQRELLRNLRPSLGRSSLALWDSLLLAPRPMPTCKHEMHAPLCRMA